MSTFSEEFADCDPDIAIIPCDPEDVSGPPSLGPTISVGSDCGPQFGGITTTVSSLDADGDYLKDHCEWALASAFQPLLRFSLQESHSGREPYWIVERIGYEGSLSIMYMLSYYYDGPLFTHQGDSEFIRLKLNASGGGWAISWAFLSAHWGAGFGQDWSQHVAGGNLSYEMGRPVVFVSKNHHANYRSYTRCNDHYFEGCTPLASAAVLVGTDGTRDVGSRMFPYDLDVGMSGVNTCTRSKASPGVAPRPGIECFFSTHWSTFAGWSGSTGTTHYLTVLTAMGY